MAAHRFSSCLFCQPLGKKTKFIYFQFKVNHERTPFMRYTKNTKLMFLIKFIPKLILHLVQFKETFFAIRQQICCVPLKELSRGLFILKDTVEYTEKPLFCIQTSANHDKSILRNPTLLESRQLAATERGVTDTLSISVLIYNLCLLAAVKIFKKKKVTVHTDWPDVGF